MSDEKRGAVGREGSGLRAKYAEQLERRCESQHHSLHGGSLAPVLTLQGMLVGQSGVLVGRKVLLEERVAEVLPVWLDATEPVSMAAWASWV